MNIFDKELETKTLEIKKCKEEKQKSSCSKCDEFFGCKIRNEYVKAVYFSMNKGDTGGFDF